MPPTRSRSQARQGLTAVRCCHREKTRPSASAGAGSVSAAASRVRRAVRQPSGRMRNAAAPFAPYSRANSPTPFGTSHPLPLRGGPQPVGRGRHLALSAVAGRRMPGETLLRGRGPAVLPAATERSSPGGRIHGVPAGAPSSAPAAPGANERAAAHALVGRPRPARAGGPGTWRGRGRPPPPWATSSTAPPVPDCGSGVRAADPCRHQHITAVPPEPQAEYRRTRTT